MREGLRLLPFHTEPEAYSPGVGPVDGANAIHDEARTIHRKRESRSRDQRPRARKYERNTPARLHADEHDVCALWMVEVGPDAMQPLQLGAGGRSQPQAIQLPDVSELTAPAGHEQVTTGGRTVDARVPRREKAELAEHEPASRGDPRVRRNSRSKPR
jgi:hypothetical protein